MIIKNKLKFKYKCYIAINTHQIRNYLKNIGYILTPLIDTEYRSYGLLCNHYLVMGVPANDKEFNINFNDKYAFSIDTLIFPIVSEKQLEKDRNINNYKNNLVGNGAYKIKNYEERKNISLIINDSYYGQLPSTAKNIEVEIVPDEEAQVSIVISLDSDIAKISLDDLSKFY